MAKYYEILVTHQEGECPNLPEHPDLQYMSPDFAAWHCPTHQVFSKVCIGAVARARIEMLKKVKDLKHIRLYYGGDLKRKNCWDRGAFGEWERI